MKTFKIDQIVFITDGSFMYNVTPEGTMEHSTKATPKIGHCKDPFVVMCTNLSLPTDPRQGSKVCNNTIIRNLVTNEEWCCNDKINLKVYNQLPILTGITLTDLLEAAISANILTNLIKHPAK